MGTLLHSVCQAMRILKVGLFCVALTCGCYTTRNAISIVSEAETIESTLTRDGFVRDLKDGEHVFRDVMISLENGTFIKAQVLVFNGSTGEFKVQSIKGHLKPDIVEIQVVENETCDMQAEHMKEDRNGLLLYNGSLSADGMSIHAPKILIWKKR